VEVSVWSWYRKVWLLGMTEVGMDLCVGPEGEPTEREHTDAMPENCAHGMIIDCF